LDVGKKSGVEERGETKGAGRRKPAAEIAGRHYRRASNGSPKIMQPRLPSLSSYSLE
jgi:hypothetical protein